MKKLLMVFGVLFFFTSCSEKYRKIDKDDVTISSKRADSLKSEPKTRMELREKLRKEGYKYFDVYDEEAKDTVIMQQYFVAFMKTGSVKARNEDETKRLQNEHLEYLKEMYELGYADISGPFGDVGEFMGMTIYSVPTYQIADSLANADPIVKEGHLDIEIHPWWAPKGSTLR